MTTTYPQSYQKAWAKAIAKPAKEFNLTPLALLSGKIPAGLQGTLYYNGPGRLERGESKIGHWFDGDGAMLAVHFTEVGAKGIYRYVKTKGYLAEAEAGKFLYGNYGMTFPGPIWDYWRRLLTNNDFLKNAANTAVLALPDKLLALWEAGNPHALDLQTLETKGLDNLGRLARNQPYSAHPLQDPHTGEVYSIGIDEKSTLNLYRSDRTGKIVQTAAMKLNGLPFLHSFVLAGQYLIFFLPPIRLNLPSIMLGLSSYCDALEWQGNQGTGILVVDRETLEVVSRGETEPWFQWHFGNGCVETDGSVRLDLVRFSDFAQSNEYLREVPTGQTHTAANGRLWQVRLNPQTSKIIETQEVVNRCCEFPVVQPQQVGQPWRYTYFGLLGLSREIGKDWFGSIARFDYQTSTLTEADLGENRYVVEPIYAADTLNPEQGWVLTVVYDGNLNTSEVWVFDEASLDEEPVCRLGLPEVIPFSFHGTWRPA
ncbi:MAG: hypothetical protein F6K14_16895 [Symploca sp. SIO2C1]|nr:hypothetical protein [Symploca sp. SIO2C1]